jgi:hypothetical protein
MKYIVYTWRGGYFTVPHLVEAESFDEALWKGVDEAIKDNTIYYMSDNEAYDEFMEIDIEERFYESEYDYMVEHCNYTYYDNDDGFVGYVNLENFRVISESDDDFERLWEEYGD